MQPALMAFVGELEAARGPGDVWERALGHFAHRGVSWLFHGYTAPLWQRDRGFLMHRSSIPTWWDRHRDERGYRHHDPAVRHCLRSAAPFPFGLGLADATYPAAARRMYAECAEWGARCGIAFPLRNVPGSPLGAMVCITGMEAAEFARWLPAAGGALHLAALAVDARLLRLAGPAPDAGPELSPRERECLLWLAAGLRTDRIADRMGVCNGAVELHFANARRKLGARTRDQALLKAVLLGLLTP